MNHANSFPIRLWVPSSHASVLPQTLAGNRKRTKYPYGTYNKHDDERAFDDNIKNDEKIWTISEFSKEKDKVYSYEEAIELAGNGCYNISLMGAMGLSLLATILDMFSFSTVVALSRCDLQIDQQQTNILISVPFIGSIIMAYAWGYISDTRGRRLSLLIAMACSFIMSTLCAFAPNAIFLGIFKLIGTCFCSQSVTYALLGESCSARTRGTYLLIMTSGIFFTMPIYMIAAYLMGYLHFSFDLVFIHFVPWRLLVLILALPLGMSALSLMFFYESPKFLVNSGKTKECLEILGKIYRRNGFKDTQYPVKKLFFNSTSRNQKDVSFVQSLWDQTAPLFKPPLLWKTLLLYYITFVIYSTASPIFIWLPFLAESFTNGVGNEYEGRGICSLICNSSGTNADDGVVYYSARYRLMESGDQVYAGISCISSVGLSVASLALILGAVCSVASFLISRLPSRKKMFTIAVIALSALCSAGTQMFSNSILNVVLYFGITLLMLTAGMVSSYYVDLFPTSYLGMASCLGVLVARISSIVGVNLMGPFMMTHCTAIFIFWAFYLLCAAFVSGFLPPDKIKSTKENECDTKTRNEEGTNGSCT